MQTEELENYTQLLLAAAMGKCGRLEDAQDLTQETLLAALSYLRRGGQIEDPRAWLLAVLHRKFNDLLRRTYREDSVSIGPDFDLPDESALPDFEDEEAEEVRRAVAYLAETYRQVIVRHYMEGRSVREIALELGIPEGTVKSRLRLGRERVRKGLDDMEKYTKQSFEPVSLRVDFSGSPGRNGEPCSLTEGDLLAQNLLWLAYPKPATAEELAQAVGVPAAYVEPVLRKLTEGELMKKSGGKYATDFMISTVSDMEKHIPAQKKLVADNFDLFWGPVNEALESLRRWAFYKGLSEDAKNALELYVAFNCLDYGIFGAFSKAVDAQQDVPDRPNGGRWIALGHVNTEAFDPADHAELLAHTYSGERIVRNEQFAGEGFEMHAYGAEGFPGDCYYASPDYTFFPENSMVDPEIAKLLYILRRGISPEAVDFNSEYLKAVPWLTKCRVLREENGKPAVNVPVLNRDAAAILWDACAQAHRELSEDLQGLLAKFLKGRGQKLPAHLTHVPPHKQYMYAYNAMLFAAVREAMSRGRLHDGHYDDTAHGVNQPPAPMVLII